LRQLIYFKRFNTQEWFKPLNNYHPQGSPLLWQSAVAEISFG